MKSAIAAAWEWNPYCPRVEVGPGWTAVVNPVTDASVVLPVAPSELDAALASLTSEDARALEEAGMLLPAGVDASRRHLAIRDMSRYSTAVESFVVHVTYDCNLSCPYCYQSGLDRSVRMTSATAERVGQLIERHSPLGTRVDLCLIGGEPLMNLGALNHLARAARGQDPAAVISMVTNGTLIDESVATQLRDAGVGSLQITMDSGQSHHDSSRPWVDGGGSYEDIMKSIRALQVHHSDAEIVINCNLTEHNRDGVEELLIDLEKVGFDGQFIPSYVFDPGDHQMEGVINKRSDAWLHATLLAERYGFIHQPFYRVGLLACPMYQDGTWIIGPDGVLYSCLSGIGQPAYRIGPIAANGLLDPGVAAERCTVLEGRNLSKACHSCMFLAVCDGNCSYFNDRHGFDCPKQSLKRNELEFVRIRAERSSL